MIDVSADEGWLVTVLCCVNLLQMVVQGLWWYDSTLLCLPHVDKALLHSFKYKLQPIESLPELMHVCDENPRILHNMLGNDLDTQPINQIVDVLQKLPRIETKLRIKGWWEGGRDKEDRSIQLRQQGGRRRDEDWMEAHADQEYVLTVNLNRINRHRSRDNKAYTARFPKPKDETWFLVLGDVENKEVLALKRIGFIRSSSRAELSFYTPECEGRQLLTLFIMSDSYLGLDQQYDIPLHILPASIETQVNTEINGELDFSD